MSAFGRFVLIKTIDERLLWSDAGLDQTVEFASHDGNLLAMDGSGSSDPDGDPTTYSGSDSSGNDEDVSAAAVASHNNK